jgi:preprotein translocase subunit SecE
MATQVGKLKNEDTQSGRPSFDASGFMAKLGEYPRRFRAFLHEVRIEMRQVTWPTRREVFVTTWVVIVTVAFFGIYFFGVDSAAQWFVQRMFKFFGHGG